MEEKLSFGTESKILSCQTYQRGQESEGLCKRVIRVGQVSQVQ